MHLKIACAYGLLLGRVASCASESAELSFSNPNAGTKADFSSVQAVSPSEFEEISELPPDKIDSVWVKGRTLTLRADNWKQCLEQYDLVWDQGLGGETYPPQIQLKITDRGPQSICDASFPPTKSFDVNELRHAIKTNYPNLRHITLRIAGRNVDWSLFDEIEKGPIPRYFADRSHVIRQFRIENDLLGIDIVDEHGCDNRYALYRLDDAGKKIPRDAMSFAFVYDESDKSCDEHVSQTLYFDLSSRKDDYLTDWRDIDDVEIDVRVLEKDTDIANPAETEVLQSATYHFRRIFATRHPHGMLEEFIPDQSDDGTDGIWMGEVPSPSEDDTTFYVHIHHDSPRDIFVELRQIGEDGQLNQLWADPNTTRIVHGDLLDFEFDLGTRFDRSGTWQLWIFDTKRNTSGWLQGYGWEPTPIGFEVRVPDNEENIQIPEEERNGRYGSVTREILSTESRPSQAKFHVHIHHPIRTDVRVQLRLRDEEGEIKHEWFHRHSDRTQHGDLLDFDYDLGTIVDPSGIWELTIFDQRENGRSGTLETYGLELDESIFRSSSSASVE